VHEHERRVEPLRDFLRQPNAFSAESLPSSGTRIFSNMRHLRLRGKATTQPTSPVITSMEMQPATNQHPYEPILGASAHRVATELPGYGLRRD
jgi:hypothetical protein